MSLQFPTIESSLAAFQAHIVAVRLAREQCRLEVFKACSDYITALKNGKDAEKAQSEWEQAMASAWEKKFQIFAVAESNLQLTL